MAYLSLNHITKHFGSARAVDDFHLDVEKGEFVSLLGGSGCGKTTTLRMIAGFETTTTGTIHIEGVEVEHLPPQKRNVGFVFQNYALFPNLTVEGNIAFGLQVAGQKKALWQPRVDELLELIHMSDLVHRYPHQLSGGQQQRVALARALAPRPRLLLLDEPLSALDAQNRQRLRQEIREIQQTLGITTVYVTHDQEEAMAISDRIVVMDKGRIEQVGTPQQIYQTPAPGFTASFIGTLNQWDGVWSRPGQGLALVGNQMLVTTPSAHAETEARVRLGVRPESLVWNGPGPNRITGTVESTAFLGAVTRVRLVTPELSLVFDHLPSQGGAGPAVGQTITVCCSSESLLNWG